MDEPTAALSAEKIRVLLGLVDALKRRGVCILLISHRFTDILHVCDRIVVVRQGPWSGELLPHAPARRAHMALHDRAMTGDRGGRVTRRSVARDRSALPRSACDRLASDPARAASTRACWRRSSSLFVVLSRLVAVLPDAPRTC